MPTPLPNEDHDEFIDRCMSDPEAMQDFDDPNQRLAFCESTWQREEEEENSIIHGYEQRLLNVSSLKIRAEDDESMGRMVGYAAVFNSLSEDLGGFREQIAPGAFRQSIGPDADIKALWNHNSDNVIGRTTSGTLRIMEDDVGLRVEIDPPQSARQYIESVKRGDVNQMSFGFSVMPGGDRFEESNDGMIIRTLTNVRLMEVSPVAFPAYRATTIDSRRFEQWRDTKKPEKVTERDLKRVQMKRKLLEKL